MRVCPAAPPCAAPEARLRARRVQRPRARVPHCVATESEAPVVEAAAVSDAVESQKAALLRLLATPDRGAAATGSDRAAVEACVSQLEAVAVSTSTHSLRDRLSGKWRLAYSSTFAGVAGGSQGFTGPPGAGTPVRLGAVFQRVQLSTKARLDNIVELQLPGLLPFTTLPASVCLSHSCEALGMQAVLPLQLRGGRFDTTFCDADFRISRGDRGELRIFTRV